MRYCQPKLTEIFIQAGKKCCEAESRSCNELKTQIDQLLGELKYLLTDEQRKLLDECGAKYKKAVDESARADGYADAADRDVEQARSHKILAAKVTGAGAVGAAGVGATLVSLLL